MDAAPVHHSLDFVPLLAPDETLFSFLARASCLGAYGNAHQTAGDWPSRRAGLVFDFPYELERLTRVMLVGQGNPEQLACAATCLPFYTRFRKSAFSGQAARILCGSSVGLLKHDLGLRASAAGSMGAIRACPECMSDDVGGYGTAYWHRSLQLPGVLVCPKHEVALMEAKSMRPGKQQTFFLPRQIEYAKSDHRRLTRTANKRALQFSRLASAALQTPFPGDFDAEALYHTYRAALKAEGLLSKSGRLRLVDLETRIEAHIEGLPDGVRLCRPEVSRGPIALISVLRARSETFNTVPHLVLIEMLFGSWERFIAMYEWQTTLSSAPIMHKDATASPPIRVVPNSRMNEDQRRNRWSEATDHIERYMRQHPEASRSRVKMETTSNWRWLYRNDPTWLISNTPPLRSGRTGRASWVNWSSRDAKMCKLIARERPHIVISNSSRITAATILRQLGELPFSVQLAKMPQTALLLEEIVNSMKRERT
ncbi:TnsD family Tn7-like transposition protein [Paraburkholderia fynbosensis]|uniref:Uncharacterized protein n=1 Tax=Paraburkholderia fynbosensis TaxID=1200993 RepID=A0A6J5FI67_9BURK|nr:TnsD family Tn7-like transposition protein [Paraburkholderia fynbosensis]CAB3780346.1 hypothetical protein LMG27177_00900 [Paraburkholderia fynbosensis]